MIFHRNAMNSERDGTVPAGRPTFSAGGAVIFGRSSKILDSRPGWNRAFSDENAAGSQISDL